MHKDLLVHKARLNSLMFVKMIVYFMKGYKWMKGYNSITASSVDMFKNKVDTYLWRADYT